MSMRKKFPGSVVRANPVVPTEDSAPGIWTLEQQNQNQSKGKWPFVGDPNFKDTVLLLHGDTSQQPSIEDKSASNHEVTIAGDSKATNWSPFNLPEGYWSNYFDGDNNYLWISNIPIGTQPYTLECFVFVTTGVQEYHGIFSAGATNGNSIQFQLRNELMRISSFNAEYLIADAGDEVPLNTWTHLAFVRDSSNVLRFFKDGVLIKSGTDSHNWSETTADMLVGRVFNSATYDFEGYISNLHFVVGTAKYTSSFSKPTAPITPDVNTKLLTCQSNSFNNKSADGGSLGSVGDAEVATFSPFSYTPTATVNNYGSYYFDGNGDYLKAANNGELDLGTGDFTIEAWLYLSSAPHDYQMVVASDGGNQYVTLRASSVAVRITSEHQISYTTTPGANEWFHLAVVRSGSTITVYIDGVSIGTATDSGDFNLNSGGTLIGAFQGPTHYFDGYISNLRIIKGTALYTSAFTPSTKPVELTLTEGENSVYFDTSGDYLELTGIDFTDFNFGTGEFLIEGWIYYTSQTLSSANTILGQTGWGNTLQLNASGYLQFYQATSSGNSGTFWITGTSALPLNRWTHFAIQRDSSGNLDLWINGTREATNTTYASTTMQFHSAKGNITLHHWNGTTANNAEYISNFRIKNSAVYTSGATITVPTTPFSRTEVLLACASRYIEDRSSANHDIAANGDAVVSGFNPFNDGYWSVHLDSTSDKIQVATASALPSGTAARTIEFWAKVSGSPNGTQYFFGYGNGGQSSYGGNFSWARNGSGYFAFFGWGGTPHDWATSVTVPQDEWFHVSLTSSGSQIKFYLNGTLEHTQSYATSTGSVSNLYINQEADGSGFAFDNLKISNFIVYSSVVRTGNFTAPTVPETDTTNVVLLVAQSSRPIDNSSNSNTVTFTGATIDQDIPFTLLSRQTKLLNLQNNQDVNNRSFQDSSILKTFITRTGNVTQGTFTPFSAEEGKWSNYFDGTDDRLTVVGGENIGTGDFTISAWVYRTSSGTYPVILDTRSSDSDVKPVIYTDGANLYYYSGGAIRITGSNVITNNVWHFVRLVKSSGVTKLFLDGSQVGSNYSDSNNYAPTNDWEIGSRHTNQHYWPGYISNLQVVLSALDGTSVPTKPFETPTVNGEQSVYFDGNGDYLIANADSKLEFDNNQFSVEWWENRPSVQSFDIALQLSEGGDNYSMLFGYNRQVLYASSAASSWDVLNNWNMYGSYTSKYGLNKWTHICVTRDSSGQIRAFIDGVMTNNTNIGASTNIYQEENAVCFGSGQGYSQNHSANIYISNARICIGSIPTDYQTSSTTNGTTIFTPSTDPFTTTSQGASDVKLLALRSKIFSDDSDNPTSMTAYNQTEIRYSNPFNDGYWSNSFLSNDERLSMAASSDFRFGTGDFTVELWVKYTNSSGDKAMIDFRPTNGQYADAFGFTITGTALKIYDNANRSLGGTVSTNVWTHLVLQRVSGVLYAHVNGTATGTTVSYTTDLGNTGTQCTIGSTTGSNTARFDGHISNVRVVKGSAIYGTGNFTVSTAPFTTTSQGATASEVKLLTCQSNRFIDNSSTGHSITVGGTTSIKEDIPFTLLSRQTKLLTCQSNRFKDEADNKTITVAGNPKVFPYAPFASSRSYSKDVVGGSARFDGSGDKLKIEPENDKNIFNPTTTYTLEGWLYVDIDSPGTRHFLSKGGTAAGWIPTNGHYFIMFYYNNDVYLQVKRGSNSFFGINSSHGPSYQWNHFAVGYDGTTTRFWWNGESIGSSILAPMSDTSTDGQNMFLGVSNDSTTGYWPGYISNVRYVRGTDIYGVGNASITVPTSPPTAVTNTNFLATFTDGAVIDNSSKANLETGAGAATEEMRVSTSIKKFGNASMYFDGGDVLRYYGGTGLHLGTGPFTAELFVKFDGDPNNGGTNGQASLMRDGGYGTGGGGFVIQRYNGEWEVGTEVTPQLQVAQTLENLTWYHVALTRDSSSNLRLFVDGTQLGSTVANFTSPFTENRFYFGNFSISGGTGGRNLTGYLDDIRITKGVARYTSNFTAPTRAFKNR